MKKFKWIKCSEELPQNGDWYMVVFKPFSYNSIILYTYMLFENGQFLELETQSMSWVQSKKDIVAWSEVPEYKGE